MNQQQEQIIKDALNIGIESVTRAMDETYTLPDENKAINHHLETLDNAWDILFPKETQQ